MLLVRLVVVVVVAAAAAAGAAAAAAAAAAENLPELEAGTGKRGSRGAHLDEQSAMRDTAITTREGRPGGMGLKARPCPGEGGVGLGNLLTRRCILLQTLQSSRRRGAGTLQG